MKVVLNTDVDNVGQVGDIVDVKPGFARNYLMRRKLAVAATKAAVAQANKIKEARERKVQVAVEASKELAARIEGTILRIQAKSGEEGQLFGSVTSAEIAEELQRRLSTPIDRKNLVLAEPIRSLGVHSYLVKLPAEGEATGRVEVVAS